MVMEASSSAPSATGRPISNADHELISSSSSSSTLASSAIDFLSLCHRLKATKRAGWVKRDVKDLKSIANHMYRMGSMPLIASDIPGVDRDKSDGIPKVEKIRE